MPPKKQRVGWMPWDARLVSVPAQPWVAKGVRILPIVTAQTGLRKRPFARMRILECGDLSPLWHQAQNRVQRFSPDRPNSGRTQPVIPLPAFAKSGDQSPHSKTWPAAPFQPPEFFAPGSWTRPCRSSITTNRWPAATFLIVWRPPPSQRTSIRSARSWFPRPKCKRVPKWLW